MRWYEVIAKDSSCLLRKVRAKLKEQTKNPAIHAVNSKSGRVYGSWVFIEEAGSTGSVLVLE